MSQVKRKNKLSGYCGSSTTAGCSVLNAAMTLPIVLCVTACVWRRSSEAGKGRGKWLDQRTNSSFIRERSGRGWNGG